MPSTSGRITLLALALGVVLFAAAIVLDPFTFSPYVPQPVQAGTATTTVTVTNTPPQWVASSTELGSYTTSTPANAGQTISFIGTGSSSNGNRLYLLICKTSTAPTANPGSAPTCFGGGANLWTASASTTSGNQMQADYVTTSTNPENNPWWGFLCDGDAFNPLCNPTAYQGTSATNSSPWVLNHWPNFTSTVDTSPANPGAVVTWNTSSSDPDVYGGANTVQLWVCKSNDFVTSTCGAAGTWCSSTFAASNPTCTSTLPFPDPSGNYNAYTYVQDNRLFSAVGPAEATNTVVTVNNVAPSITSSSISLLNTTGAGPLILTVPQGQTTGFRVTYTISDGNSCMTQGGGQEASSSIINVYRSGVGQANCQTSGQYNANSCYPAAVGTSIWNYACSQDGGGCSGTSSPNTTWTCTFPLWYLTDATDGANATDTQRFAEIWQVSVRATDKSGATSTLVEAQTGQEVQSYLAYVMNTLSIPYGSLAPGSSTPTLVPSTTVQTAGNVGLDETLYGADMCTTFPACTPGSTTSTIDIVNQKYASSSVNFTSTAAVNATSITSTVFAIHILKATATSTPTFGGTYWGIAVPGSITIAGNYSGQNTIIGVKSSAAFW